MRTASRPARKLAAFAALVLAAGMVEAQAGPPTFEDRVEVRLVELEVFVSDTNGHPVRGLEREDFVLRQGSHRIDILHFRPPRPGPSVPEDAAEPDADRDGNGLTMAILIDRAFLRPGDLEEVVQTLRAFLARGWRAQDRLLLADANYSLVVRQPLTEWPEDVRQALDRLEPEPGRSRAAAEFERLRTQIERQATQGEGFSAKGSDTQPLFLKSQIDNLAVQTRREIELSAHHLLRLLPALAGLPGQKAILYIGATLPTSAGQQLFNAWRSAFGPGSRYQRSATPGLGADQLLMVGPSPETSEAEAGEVFRVVADRANAAGVTVHVLDAGALLPSGGLLSSSGIPVADRGGGVVYGAKPDPSRRLGDPRALLALAESTGGRAVTGNRAYADALRGVEADQGAAYILAFEPPQVDDELHEIEVELRRGLGQLQLRHRSAYRGRSEDQLCAEQAISALLLGSVSNPLGVELRADAPRPGAARDDLSLLPLHVIFPVAGVTLLEQSGEHVGRLSLFLTSGDLESGPARVQTASIPLRFRADQLAEVRQRNVEYNLELPIPTGAIRVAVALRDELRPGVSTAVLTLPARQ